MLRIKNKKAQSMIEMCICVPVFMVCIFGAFDLTLMISALMDTMVITRDSIREMSLIKESDKTKVRNDALATAISLASMAQRSNGFIEFKFLRGNSPSHPRGVDNELVVQNGPSVHNSPHLVQACSHVKLIVPWMWGLRSGEDMKVCASYFMLRQFQPTGH